MTRFKRVVFVTEFLFHCKFFFLTIYGRRLALDLFSRLIIKQKRVSWNSN